MTVSEVLRSVQELADLMVRFADDPAELVSLSERMRVRLEQLDRLLFTVTA